MTRPPCVIPFLAAPTMLFRRPRAKALAPTGEKRLDGRALRLVRMVLQRGRREVERP